MQEMMADLEVLAKKTTTTDSVAVHAEYARNIIDAHGNSLDSLIRTVLDLTGMSCDNWVRKRKASTACSYDAFVFCLWLI
jgi:hypothetical protein